MSRPRADRQPRDRADPNPERESRHQLTVVERHYHGDALPLAQVLVELYERRLRRLAAEQAEHDVDRIRPTGG